MDAHELVHCRGLPERYRASAAMNGVSADLLAACRVATAEIQRLRSRQQGPIVVALDGGSGAGKSTLARLIENEIEAALIQRR